MSSDGSAQQPPDYTGSGLNAVHRKLRILVVDDSVDGADSMCAVLRLFGNDAEMAHDGETAIAMAATYLPDLVLMDLSLPSLSGYETGKRVKSVVAPAAVAIVAVTGWGRDEDRAKSLEFGFDAHLTKPVDFQQLKSIIRGVAEARGIAGA